MEEMILKPNDAESEMLLDELATVYKGTGSGYCVVHANGEVHYCSTLENVHEVLDSSAKVH